MFGIIFIFCELCASFLTWSPELHGPCCFYALFAVQNTDIYSLLLISKWAAETCFCWKISYLGSRNLFCWKVSFNPFKATIFVNFVLLLTQMGSSINAAAVLKCKIKNKCCFLTCTFTILCKMFHNMYLV